MSNVYVYTHRTYVPDYGHPHRFLNPKTFVIKMEDVAQKITKRIYGDDKVKYEVILNMLYYEQKMGNYNEVVNYYLQGNMDEFIMGIMEYLEGTIDFEDMEEMGKRHKHVREYANCMPIREFKKLMECIEDENILYLGDIEKMNKDQIKNALKRIIKRMGE